MKLRSSVLVVTFSSVSDFSLLNFSHLGASGLGLFLVLFNIGFAHSKWPHLHRAYLLGVWYSFSVIVCKVWNGYQDISTIPGTTSGWIKKEISDSNEKVAVVTWYPPKIFLRLFSLLWKLIFTCVIEYSYSRSVNSDFVMATRDFPLTMSH